MKKREADTFEKDNSPSLLPQKFSPDIIARLDIPEFRYPKGICEMRYPLGHKKYYQFNDITPLHKQFFDKQPSPMPELPGTQQI